MRQEEFYELLKKSGLPKKFNQIVDHIMPFADDHNERLERLEARVWGLENKLNNT
ncbi:hypothetical protein KJ980_08555 [Patescibacteria group bacterium]|nr:hypothetical protein [Patescibacteria group bacterium]MBU4016183.1 hypothetical protein [Patescibacteria group bacterium]MBU4099665.1 hypothetical protein [Patescibacteria group bacterium]